MSNRWLIIIGSAIAALIIVGVVVAISTQGKGVQLLAEDSPEGTVQRYLLALEEEDYPRAYNYLASSVKEEKTYPQFLRETANSRNEGRQVVLEKARVYDDSAQVVVTISEFRPAGPLTFQSSERSFKTTFFLQKENGKWYLFESTWPIWVPGLRKALPPPPVPVR